MPLQGRKIKSGPEKKRIAFEGKFREAKTLSGNWFRLKGEIPGLCKVVLLNFATLIHIPSTATSPQFYDLYKESCIRVAKL